MSGTVSTSFVNFGAPLRAEDLNGAFSLAVAASALATTSNPELGAALIGYSGRTLAAHLADFPQAGDFGADLTGITDSTNALNNFGAAIRLQGVARIPAGVITVGGSITPRGILWWLDGTTTSAGAPANSGFGSDLTLTHQNGTLWLNKAGINPTVTGNSFANLASAVAAQYAGGSGTGGVPITAHNFYLSASVGAAVTDTMHALTATVSSAQTGGGGPAAAHFETTKEAGATVGAWGALVQAFDQTTRQSAMAGGTVGVEVDLAASGPDNAVPSGVRAGIDVLAWEAATSPDGASVVSHGVRVRPTQGPAGPCTLANGFTATASAGGGVVTNGFFCDGAATGLLLTGKFSANAIDLTGISSAGGAGIALSSGIGVNFATIGGNAHTLAYQGGALAYGVGNAVFFQLNDAGWTAFGSAAVASLPATPSVNGAIMWASNGRKSGETAGAGTGVLVAYSRGPSGNGWYVVGTNALVQA